MVSQEQMTKYIATLAEEMKAETLEAGIPEAIYLKMVSNLDCKSLPELIALSDWLQEVHREDFNEILKIRKLVPAKNWMYYKLNPGFRPLREQILLAKAQKKLKQTWRNRPLFKKTGK